MLFSVALELSDYIWLSVEKSANFANTLAPCNLHKNCQNRQIRQHVRPIFVHVICIKIAKIAKSANTLDPSPMM